MNDNKKSKRIVTRIAPSPTGVMHLGTAHTAQFNYLFARQHKGTFILRFEDTDKARSNKEFEADIIASMEWLGLEYDTEITRQSERTDVYKEYLQKMLDDGNAYVSNEEPKKEGDRARVIRLRNPNKKVLFHDIIRGDIEFDTAELGDIVIAKDMESPLYHLTVVVDDLKMGVTHVIRGEDGISNTPRQILIQEAIGAERPEYAHIPFILAPDGSKLSKRHGSISVTEYKKAGYLPEAMNNFLMLMGWHPKDDREFFTMDELVEVFELERVQKGGATWSNDKLDWYNKAYLKKKSDDEYREYAVSFLPDAFTAHDTFMNERLNKLLPTLRERVTKGKDITDMAEGGELTYLITAPELVVDRILWKKDPEPAHAGKHLTEVVKLLDNIEQWNFESVKAAIWLYADKEGRGDVLWPMRFSLTGLDKSPDPITVADILGKEETISRLQKAATILHEA